MGKIFTVISCRIFKEQHSENLIYPHNVTFIYHQKAVIINDVKTVSPTFYIPIIPYHEYTHTKVHILSKNQSHFTPNCTEKITI